MMLMFERIKFDCQLSASVKPMFNYFTKEQQQVITQLTDAAANAVETVKNEIKQNLAKK